MGGATHHERVVEGHIDRVAGRDAADIALDVAVARRASEPHAAIGRRETQKMLGELLPLVRQQASKHVHAPLYQSIT
jgi:hypothetical protein